MRLERITVQAFRGYPSRADVVLSGNVVLLSGENGSGKTSLTEAFEWVMFDSIVRKERSKTRGEYQGSSWIRSVHAAPEAETYAEITLSKGDRRHVVRRVLAGNGTELTIDGSPASDVRALGLRTEAAFRPFLGQCEIQAVIDSEQQSRWEQLSAILGFVAFGQLRERLQRLRTDAERDARVRRLRERVTRAVQPLTPAGQDPLAQAPLGLRARAAGFLGLDTDAAEWESIRYIAQKELDALLVKDRRPTGLNALVIGSRDVGPEAARTAAAVNHLATRAEEHRAWHEANRQGAFAAQGLELVDPNEPTTCPFCAQPTLRDARVAVLQDHATRTTGPVPADPRPELRNGIAVLVEAGPLNPDAVSLLLESLGDAPESTILQEAQAEQALLDALRDRAGRLVDAALAAYETASRPDRDARGLSAIVTELVAAVEEIGQRHAALRAQVEAANLELTQRFSGLSDDDKERIRALQMAVLLGENGSAVEAAWRLRNLQEQLKLLVTALEAAEKERMASALRTLSADIARYYEELSPGHHIKISGIAVRDSKHRQAALAATSHGTPVNPVTMFSEAEGNCLGLSLYFSQRVDRNPGWSMIMLDDPVQSMDQGHEEGLINLLARVSRDRQVIVMTHARRFASQVEAQFAAVGSFTKYVFERGSGPDPQIALAEGRLDELLTYAEANAQGELARRESCAGAIRKAVERFCRELAAKTATQLKKGLSVEDMINRLHQQKAIDDLEVGTLHRLRKFGNLASHDDEAVNPATSAILSNVSALRGLRDRHLQSPQKPALTLLAGGGETAAELA
jgi:energy-coupling factor transporter ATP-binding protein EcfA2